MATDVKTSTSRECAGMPGWESNIPTLLSMHVVTSTGKRRVTKHRLRLCIVYACIGSVNETLQIPPLSAELLPLVIRRSQPDDLRAAFRFPDG